MSVLELAVLADDLTGGMIISSLLEKAGVVCPLVTSADELDALEATPTAVVLARKIRLIPAKTAREEARIAADAFIRRGARTLYYKYSALFDSTAEGNIGPIAETLLEATGSARTLFCPVWVEQGLSLYKGHLFLQDTLVSESAKRFDPVTPATTSSVVKALRAQTSLEVGLIDHQTLGSESGLAALEGAARPFLVVDALDVADVDRLAWLTRDWRFVTGADSLAPAIIRERRRGAEFEPGSARSRLPPSPGFEAVLAGSCAAATASQLDAFAVKHPIWRIDLARDGDDAGLIGRIVAWAAERLPYGPIAISTSADPAGVQAAQEGFGRDGASARVDRLLGEAAVQLRTLGVRKFVVAGGEAAGAVLSALGVKRLQVGAYDGMYGGYCHQPGASPTSFVVKAGGLGREDFFFRALSRMQEAEHDPARKEAP